MTDELSEVVEAIGKLGDRAEYSKWELSEAVATAYAEFHSYTRGLTAGLCARLRKSTDLIYSLRDAWELKSLLVKSDSPLSVSHFAVLSRLRDRYTLSDDDCREWLTWAEEVGASVREMSIEVSMAHDADPLKSFMRRVEKVGREVQRLWEDCESINLSEDLRALTKAALKVLREWIKKLLEWGL